MRCDSDLLVCHQAVMLQQSSRKAWLSFCDSQSQGNLLKPHHVSNCELIVMDLLLAQHVVTKFQACFFPKMHFNMHLDGAGRQTLMHTKRLSCLLHQNLVAQHMLVDACRRSQQCNLQARTWNRQTCLITLLCGAPRHRHRLT